MVVTYDPGIGEHIRKSAEAAIKIARRLSREVRFRFNGVTLKVRKQHSVDHIVRTFDHMNEARRLRSIQSPAGIRARKARIAEVAEKQKLIDELVANMPATYDDVPPWLAKYVPLSDDIGVDRKPSVVSAWFKALGFVDSAHVGDEELKAGTADRKRRIEYLAGQVICGLDSRGGVHPMIGSWASKL